MAILENVKTGKRIILFTRHSFGRDLSNICVIERKDVSRNHAIIHWEKSCWYLTDVSCNGTFVNKITVCHTSVELKKNDLIHFAGDHKNIWKLIDSGEPSSFLRSLDRSEENIELMTGIVFWDQRKLKTLFKDIYQRWFLDDGDSIKNVESGDVFVVNQIEYEFVENEYLEDTQRNFDILSEICLRLEISEDEEEISSQIIMNDLVYDLGVKSYNYLLLILIRNYEEDKKKNIPLDKCGWINMRDLSILLGKEILKDIDEYYINNLIYRLKKNLLRIKPYGNVFSNVIQRKRGKLRFGLNHFEIKKVPFLVE